MFTGMIEEVGIVKKVENRLHSAVLEIQATIVLQDLKVGDSIAVNGVCLTVVAFWSHSFLVDVMNETLNCSTLALLKSGSHVNLERAMSMSGRFGGHIVSGHVDSTGKIIEIKQDDIAVWYIIQADVATMRHIVEKGSITIDGISLTVVKVFDDCFSISAIPHTTHATILGEHRVGDIVNLETDIIGKYIERFISSTKEQLSSSKLTREFLSMYGY